MRLTPVALRPVSEETTLNPINEGRSAQRFESPSAELFPGDDPSLEEFSVTVPKGQLWVMGDHRSVSEDSRAHREQPGKGFVPIDDVVGRAFTIVWPLDRTQLLRRPATFERTD